MDPRVTHLPDEPRTPGLPVAELFGPTFQGEGPSCGRLAVFVRLGGCNLTCTWCDTPYTWDATRYDLREQIHRRPVTGIAAYIASMPAHALVVITGGEPLLHQHTPAWRQLTDHLRADWRDTEIETNGTRVPDAAWSWAGLVFNVSPKLRPGGDPEHKRIVPEALDRFAELAEGGRARFKFAATGPGDLTEVQALVTAHKIPDRAVWIMPEGTTPDRLLAAGRALADPVLDHGWNLTLRLHTQLWPEEKSR